MNSHRLHNQLSKRIHVQSKPITVPDSAFLAGIPLAFRESALDGFLPLALQSGRDIRDIQVVSLLLDGIQTDRVGHPSSSVLLPSDIVVAAAEMNS